MLFTTNHYGVVKKVGEKYRLVVMESNDLIWLQMNRKEGTYYGRREREEGEPDPEKLAQSISRAKRNIFEIGMCNDWDYFITLTISPDLFDRYNLDAYYKAFSQWLRNYGNRVTGTKIKFIFVPEQHEDGAWHIHGLISGLPAEFLENFIPGKHPDYLIKYGYKNWPAYEAKFGFCSLSRVENQMAISCYITKYVTKDMARLNTEYGAHLYRASQGLKRGEIMHQDFVTASTIFFDYMGANCGIKTYDSFEECMKVFQPSEEEVAAREAVQAKKQAKRNKALDTLLAQFKVVEVREDGSMLYKSRENPFEPLEFEQLDFIEIEKEVLP